MKKFLYVIIPMLILVAVPAMAGEQPVSWEVSGSLMDNQIDTNGDGISAAEVEGGAKGTWGHSEIRGFNEAVFVTPTGACTSGWLEVGLHNFKAVQRFKSGDLLIYHAVAGSACLEPSTLAITYDYSFVVIAGTGKFAGASGAVDWSGSFIPLVADATGGVAFAAVVGEISGTIITVED